MVSVSLNSCSIRLTPLFGKASKENHSGKDDGSNGANRKKLTRTPGDLGKRQRRASRANGSSDTSDHEVVSKEGSSQRCRFCEHGYKGSRGY